MPVRENDLRQLVQQKIESVRTKLLDLSARNPLISTKTSERSNAFFRIVDIDIHSILELIFKEREISLAPLPALDDAPADEERLEFRRRLSELRETDETYLRALENFKQQEADDEETTTRKEIERALRDRVRADLGMPPRESGGQPDLRTHARLHDIDPGYKLPWRLGSTGRRESLDSLQTLWLQKDLDRKLSALRTKYRTSLEETGINVLHLAIGFLEWKDPQQNRTFSSPLLLVPISLVSERGPQGQVFKVKRETDEVECNIVLQEKLRREFGIDFPTLKPDSDPLTYLRSVAESTNSLVSWRLSKSVVLGLFPSHRLAMYRDLEENAESLADHPTITDLLCGTEAATGISFAEDYEVDETEIETAVPYLVQDADASQFSACVDVASGRNLALEGPPGTGKSQTIVNVIADAMQAGKTVLFVASKQAALDVVRSRLEAVDLGDFILPLIAGKTSRATVIDSVKNRLSMQRPAGSREYENQRQSFQEARDELGKYIELSASPFRRTGLTVHHIITKALAAERALNEAGLSVESSANPRLAALDERGRSALLRDAQEYMESVLGMSDVDPCWSAVDQSDLDRFAAEGITASCEELVRCISFIQEAWSAANLPGKAELHSPLELRNLHAAAESLASASQEFDRRAVARALGENRIEDLEELEALWNETREDREKLELSVKNPNDPAVLQQSAALWESMRNNGIRNLDLDKLQTRIVKLEDEISEYRKIQRAAELVLAEAYDHDDLKVSDLFDAARLVAHFGLPPARIPEIQHSDLLTALKRLCIQVGELKDLHYEIESFSDWRAETIDIDPVETLKTIRSAGAFSFLSAKYRRAKRALGGLSRTGTFDAKSASEFLQKLHALRALESELAFRKELLDFLPTGFRGAETDLEELQRVHDFHNAVLTKFGDLSKRSVLNFLLQGDISILSGLPTNHSSLAGERLDNMASVLSKKQSELENSRSDLLESEQQLSFLIDPLSITLQKAYQLTQVLENFQANASKCLAAVMEFLPENGAVRDRVDGIFPLHREAFILKEVGKNSSAELRSFLSECLYRGKIEDLTSTFSNIGQSATKVLRLFESIGNSAGESAVRRHSEFDLGELHSLYRRRTSAQDSLIAYSRLAGIRQKLAPHELTSFLAQIEARPELITKIPKLVESAMFLAMARQVYVEQGQELSRFAGTKLNRLRRQLAEADIQLRRLAQQVVKWRAYRHGEKAPAGRARGRKTEFSEMALLRHQTGLKRPSASLRKLVHQAPESLQRLKLCWMMSPSEVAELLPSKDLTFDLCIIDEASQMPPEDALGTLARCRQALIAGDTNQLPPTSFFRAFFSDAEDDEDETIIEESVLELANGAFRPPRQLRWHYRSKHSSLINFSNHYIYGDRLTIFPSAEEREAGTGLQLVRVAGIYQGSRNVIEARAIAKAAIEFMKKEPDLSLGIVVMNQPQRDYLIDELEQAIALSPAAQDYQARWTSERDGLDRLFVKNLENVQGDERDVIFIGTVYGPQKLGGPVMNRFGPINGKAGQRRLNVLFSRARERIVTFTSMSPSDIRIDDRPDRGASLLKAWLEYSSTGLLPDRSRTTGASDSPFEDFVAERIRELGCEVDHQIGVCGYSIDLGIRYESWPYGYILGVECDGATYHSQKSARDRDRLRQEVLESRGWCIHRIWSTDWFEDADREVKNLEKILQERIEECRDRVERPAGEYLDDVISKLTPDEPLDDSSFDEAQEAFQEELSIAPVEAEISPARANLRRESTAVVVEIGDRVEVEYLPSPGERRIFRISDRTSDPKAGVITFDTPLAEALLGRAGGETVEYQLERERRSVMIREILKDRFALDGGS